MIGTHEDIYPFSKELFKSKYQEIAKRNLREIEDVADRNGIIMDKIEGCRLIMDSYVYARQMEMDFEVYTKHCDLKLYGKKGDYYTVTYEDPENAYIIKGNIMDDTYEKVDNKQK